MTIYLYVHTGEGAYTQIDKVCQKEFVKSQGPFVRDLHSFGVLQCAQAGLL